MHTADAVFSDLAQSCPVVEVGYTEHENAQEVTSLRPLRRSVYLNLENISQCDGIVYGWRYCSKPISNPPHELTLAVFHPLANGTYQLVRGSIYKLRLKEMFQSRTCKTITLSPSRHFAIQREDVVAMCSESRDYENLFYTLLNHNLHYWNAGGCSQADIALSGGSLSTRTNRILQLSAIMSELPVVTHLVHKTISSSMSHRYQ